MLVQEERRQQGAYQVARREAHSGPAPARTPPPTDLARAWRRAVGNGALYQLAERTPGAGPVAGRVVHPVLQRACGCGGSCASRRGEEERHELQPSLIVGPTNDRYEQEAERIADQVIRMSGAALDEGPRREGTGVRIQALAAGAGPGATSLDIGSITGGRSLSPTTRQFMEPRFRVDFHHVRLHDGSDAHRQVANLSARAFTYGHHIWLGEGESEQDRRLMAHELTHVVQQSGGLTGEAPAVGSVQPAAPVRSVQRAISPELEEIESLLSYGLFDWAIRDKEALRALQLLKQLPRFQQAVFFSDPTLVERLRDNLPEERLRELSELEAGVADIRPPTPTVEDIRTKLSYGLFDWAITDEEAIEALEQLKKLSGADLAVALASIDYGRLMDNLPDERKRELIDLLAQGLGTGGARETEEKRNPGTILRSITFKSDHGMMKDNDSDWTNAGNVRSGSGQTEWFVASDNDTISHPISQKLDTNIEVEVGLNVLPVGAPPAPIRLIGRSAEGALSFEFAGTMGGGLDQKVTMVSTGKLPPLITYLPDREITWTMQWRDWTHEIGRTSHTVFVTMDTPRRPGEVTYKRMRTSVQLVGAVGILDPHALIRRVMERWGAYNLDVVLDNDWELADNLDRGAQCIDIVGFVNGMIETVGVPGLATAVVVWARPDSPFLPQENVYPHGGIFGFPPPVGHPNWFAGLMDANGCPNNFEAALRFQYPLPGGTVKYYPGGVPMDREYLSAADVLHVFQCLAWLSVIGDKEFNIESIPATYPGGSCSLGRIRCH